MSTRVPHQTKPGPDVVDFPTGKEKRFAEVVEAVRKLYAGKPVGSPAIGAAVGMSHHQTLVYLREAEQAGLVKAVRRAGGSVYGWRPG
jgi:hypothetical protein